MMPMRPHADWTIQPAKRTFPSPGAAIALLAVALLACARPVLSHHSYAMFDMLKSAEVSGTVAKLEWVNPHTFVWVYVKKPDKPGEFDLYAFENGAIGALTRYGWSKDVLKVGEKVRVQYTPLRDGRNGGFLIKLVREDGTELVGSGLPAATRPRTPQ